MLSLSNDVRVTSWQELQCRLYEGAWQEGLQRFRSPMVFRGIPNVNFSPETSLRRLGQGYERREQSLLRNFRKYAHRNAVNVDSLWNWMALAQHHGLPTRLLDWTFSPYVALHFATADLLEWRHDAAIWCVNFVRIKRHLPAILRQALREEGSDVLTVEMLDRTSPTLQKLERLSKADFLAFFEPPSLDERIINQSALFSFMSRANASVIDWLSARPKLFHRIIIPANLKWEVRDKLDQANINERVLMPGLDGLTQWLTRYYSPATSREPVKDQPGLGSRAVISLRPALLDRRRENAGRRKVRKRA